MHRRPLRSDNIAHYYMHIYLILLFRRLYIARKLKNACNQYNLILTKVYIVYQTCVHLREWRNCSIHDYISPFRKKEAVPLTKKLPAVPESVLKRRKRREVVKAARLQVSIKVIMLHITIWWFITLW